MSEQALDLRRSWRIVRRRKILVGSFVALGVLAGAGYALRTPPMVASNALVGLPASIRATDTPTQVVIAGSTPVLAAALGNIHPGMSLPALRSHVQVKSLTFNILSITAQGKTADQAESSANAVAHSYIAYVGASKSAAGTLQARLLESATTATSSSLATHLVALGAIGALLGFAVGAILALAISRADRRLRERDEIANALGVPVLASIPVGHPSDAGRWTRLLESYEPSAVHAWQLRNALRYLGQGGPSSNGSNGDRLSVTVLSLSSDRRALALGPQLAVFAASLGIPVSLVVGPPKGADAMATLRAACAAPPERSKRSRNLRVAVSHQDEAPGQLRLPGAGVSVVVATVDGQTPRVADTMRTTTTVLGVSAGAATAEQLARVAASAADDGRDIAGILVADPDPADHTTGRVPHLARPAKRGMPRRVADMPTGTRP